MSILPLLTPLLCFVTFCAASMKNSHSSLMFPGVNGQNGTNMDTTGFSEGDLLLQVQDRAKSASSDTTCKLILKGHICNICINYSS